MTRPSSHRKGRHSVRSVGAGIVLVALALGIDAVAAVPSNSPPTEFVLVFEGKHSPGVGLANLYHEGSFTATAPACASGHAADLPFVQEMAVLREFMCEDGSGSFTALLDPTIAEHGGPGVWKIIGGTGRYATLRGRGAFEGALLGGSPTDETGVTFRTIWTGVAAFDDVAPTISSVRTTAARLPRSQGMYLLRIAFSARDDLLANAVDYRVLASSDGTRLPFSEGRTTTGLVSIALRVRPPGRTRKVLLEIRATDPVGNDQWTVRSLRLPSSRARS